LFIDALGLPLSRAFDEVFRSEGIEVIRTPIHRPGSRR
jgi:hypothetical protein